MVIGAALVGVIQVAVWLSGPDILGDGVDKQSITLLAGAQRVLGLTTFGFLPLLDRVGQLLGAGKPILRFLGEGPKADRLQSGRHVAAQLPRRYRLGFLNFPQQFTQEFLGERRLAGKNLIQNCAKSVDIRPAINQVRSARGLFLICTRAFPAVDPT